MDKFLYPIPVWIRMFRGKNAGNYSMAAVVSNGTLRQLDGIGFYLVGENSSDEDIRCQISTAIEGVVIVRASNVFEAINELYRGKSHPGIVGIGGEKDSRTAKAIYRDEAMCKRPIVELPDCELDCCYVGGCFSISPEGWAKCEYVRRTPVNKEYGYCHCFLQGVDEPPTGCVVEAYVERIADHCEVQTHEAGIPYVPFDPHVYEMIEREQI